MFTNSPHHDGRGDNEIIMIKIFIIIIIIIMAYHHHNWTFQTHHHSPALKGPFRKAKIITVPDLQPFFSSLDHCPADLRKSRWQFVGTFWNKNWLVVLTILKNISQWEGLSQILWKIKNVWNHQPEKMVQFTIKILTKSSNTWDFPWKISWFWTIKKWGNPPSNSPSKFIMI